MMLKYLSFAAEAALVVYACWIMFQDNPTIKQLTFLVAITFIQSMINESKLNDIKNKLLNKPG